MATMSEQRNRHFNCISKKAINILFSRIVKMALRAFWESKFKVNLDWLNQSLDIFNSTITTYVPKSRVHHCPTISIRNYISWIENIKQKIKITVINSVNCYDLGFYVIPLKNIRRNFYFPEFAIFLSLLLFNSVELKVLVDKVPLIALSTL